MIRVRLAALVLFVVVSVLATAQSVAQQQTSSGDPDPVQATGDQGQEPSKDAEARPTPRAVTNSVTNQIPKYSDTSGTLTESTVAEVSGKIGIGTASPTEQVHITTSADVPTMLLFENTSNTLNANSVLRAKADVATTSIVSHATPRTISRYGQVLGGWSELLSFQANGMVIGTNNATPLIIGTSNVNRLHIAADGKIGVGTNAPANALHVVIADGATNVPFKAETTGVDSIVGISLKNDARNFHLRVDGADADKIKMYDATAGASRLTITNGGDIGVGTDAPSAKLHVNGNVLVSGSITGATVIGAVYQDVAEWVPATQDIAPGTVVVLDSKHSNHVAPSATAYDTRLAGVVSAQPGVILGVAGPSKEQVATTGRVRVRVDATRGPIAIGDLLVTSDVAGTAMRSEPVSIGDLQIHRPGTILGKALEPLDGGVGEILVLLSLQ